MDGPARAHRFVAGCRQVEEEGRGVRGHRPGTDDTFLGWCGLTGSHATTAAPSGTARRGRRGPRYATEGAGALLQWGFDTWTSTGCRAEADTRHRPLRACWRSSGSSSRARCGRTASWTARSRTPGCTGCWSANGACWEGPVSELKPPSLEMLWEGHKPARRASWTVSASPTPRRSAAGSQRPWASTRGIRVESCERIVHERPQRVGLALRRRRARLVAKWSVALDRIPSADGRSLDSPSGSTARAAGVGASGSLAGHLQVELAGVSVGAPAR